MSVFPKEFSPDAVEELIHQGFVKVQKHPTADLYIYNYTQSAQFSGHLKTNPTLRALRGYIVDGNGNCVARGFSKFFNLGEQPEVDARYVGRRFRIEEKVDGSCGIMYHDGQDWAIATRGSFTSEQAIEGTRILRTQYRKWLDHLSRDMKITHVFEIVYPENRIVVNYGARRDLVLLGKLTREGRSFPLSHSTWPGPIRQEYGYEEYVEHVKAYETAISGEEGFVLVYDDDHRVKVKLEEYLRLHRIVTNVSERAVWEALRARTLSALCDKVPDEFFAWITEVKVRLDTAWRHRFNLAMKLFESAPKISRKEFAEYVMRSPTYAPVAFALLDKKQERAEDLVWKMIEPKGETLNPFGARAES